jgi:heme-degrading monooxygenase HmoA
MRALVSSRGNIKMILEVAILNIRRGESADFERAFAEAQAIIAAMPGYVSRMGEAFAHEFLLIEMLNMVRSLITVDHRANASPLQQCTLGLSRGNITMILEVANLNIRLGESADFERAFAKAQAIIAARPGYVPVRARHSYMSCC